MSTAVDEQVQVQLPFHDPARHRPQISTYHFSRAIHAADGFNIMPPLLPVQLDVFSTEVIPILQRRRLFRTEYSGTMLREHYGLPWPASAFDDPAWRAELREAAAGI